MLLEKIVPCLDEIVPVIDVTLLKMETHCGASTVLEIFKMPIYFKEY
jgi:hypothetical protein